MITINHLKFSYTKEPFIKDISFQVEKGEIFGFLGPSGAGKSTIQKILIGLLSGYEGSVLVNHTEAGKHNTSFYEEIGVDFEYPSLYEKMTARQNLEFFSSLYANYQSKKQYTPEELLKEVGLLADADKRVGEFSKGMKSRLNFIKAIIHKPKLLFLDEPTSGLDPTNARIMKDMIRKQKQLGTTILLTTHNMEDANELCDRVAFIVNGEIKALDTPHALIMKRGAGKIRYSYLEQGEEKNAECNRNQSGMDELLCQLIRENRLLTIHSSEPNLGDIFLDITGRSLI